MMKMNSLTITTINISKSSISDIESLPQKNAWIRVTNLLGNENSEFVKELCSHFNIHSLTLEDITYLKHQSKYDSYEEYKLFIIKTLNEYDPLKSRQFSIISFPELIITFEEQEYSPISEFIKKSKNVSFNNVIYNLLDHIVDQYLNITYKYQEDMDNIAEDMGDNPQEKELVELFRFKRVVRFFRRVVKPSEDIIEQFYMYNKNSSKDANMHLKDLLDHIRRVCNLVDYMLDNLNNMHTEILTQIQYRLNRVMTIMTSVSVIFLPLMFISGIYGMNFVHMPELKYLYAYPIVLASMFLLGISLLVFFIKRKLM